MSLDPLQEMQGGVYLWRGRPWWFVLSDSWSAAEPHALANQLTSRTALEPEKLAALVGARHFFALTDSKLGKWGLELKKRKLDQSLLPDIEQRLASGDIVPVDAPEQFAGRVGLVWKRLAPLLGEAVARNCLLTMLLPWRLWQERKPWHEIGYAELKELLGHRGYSLKTSWKKASPEERIELFLSFLGPGRYSPEVLKRAAFDDDMISATETMFKIWAFPTKAPQPVDLQRHLTLALSYPSFQFPLLPWHKDNLERLLARRPIPVKKLALVLEMGQTRPLPVDAIISSKLSVPDIRFALENELDLALWGRPSKARSFLEFCRMLIQAGLPPALFRHQYLLERAGDRYIFCYLLLPTLTEPMSDEQLRILNRLAPGVGLGPSWHTLPELAPAAMDICEQLSQTLDISQDTLSQYLRYREALGKEPLSKRLKTWCPLERGKQKQFLLRQLESEPNNTALQRQLRRLDTALPDKNEKKRCRKEVEQGLAAFPQQLWQSHVKKISEALLKNILGDNLLRATPRLATCLKSTDLPVDRLMKIREQHPANQEWLQSLERNGFMAAYWLDGLSADFYLDGKYIELRTETQPSEILEMGTHFQTCLNLDNGINAFSVLTNILEVNKMVLMGRDLSGKVMIRKLLGLTLKGELVGYQTYSHLAHAKTPVDQACRRFAQRCGLTLSEHAVPERIITELEWYDDGAEAWSLCEPPPGYPDDWPKDAEAISQWCTRTWVNGTPPRNFLPRRAVEFYHYLQHRSYKRPNPESTETWLWEEALRALASQHRFDLLRDPRYHPDSSENLYYLSDSVGISTEGADEYVSLLNPFHPLYRRDSIHPRIYETLTLSAIAVFATPKSLRKTCQGLGSYGAFQSEGDLLAQMAEILFLALERRPADQGWHRFHGAGMSHLMVQVGCRRSVPQWAGSFKRFTEEDPEWDEAWLARAMAGDSAALPLLQHRFRYKRRSLPLALALQRLGESPNDYIAPRPSVLLRPSYLNQARPLRALLRPRLERMKRRGYPLSQVMAAERNLKAGEAAGWEFWSCDYRDRQLDEELTRAVLGQSDYQHAGAWAKLGATTLRLELLRHLAPELSVEQKRSLGGLDFGSWRVRDLLTRIWLEPDTSHDPDPERAREMLLNRSWCEREIKSALTLMIPEQQIWFLNNAAEWMEPAELAELVEMAFGKQGPSFNDLYQICHLESVSVDLLKLVLPYVQGQPGPNLREFPRGCWCEATWRAHRECLAPI